MSRRARERSGNLKEYYANAPFPKQIPKRLNGKKYSKFRNDIYDKRGGLCDICFTNLKRDSFHIHHKKTRGSGGEDSSVNALLCCHECHHKIHMGLIDVSCM